MYLTQHAMLINALALIKLTTILLLTTAPVVFAENKYPVKLRFEHINKTTVSTLLQHANTPEIITHYWQNAHEKFHSNPPEGKIAIYDLNGDGTEEILLYLSGQSLCGQGGCHLIIFQYNGKAQRFEYLTARSSSDDILILCNIADGRHNIAIRLMDSAIHTKNKEYTVYHWKNNNLQQTTRILNEQSLENYCDESYIPGLF